jgi:uncharacterized protein (DUF58 family)
MSEPHRSRRHVVFTREGLSFVAILSFVVVGSILRQINLLVMLASMMIPALLFNWRLAVALLRRIRVRHVLPEWIFAGQTSVIELAVQNDSRRFTAWHVRLTDSIQRIAPQPERRPPRQVDVSAIAIEPDGSAHVSYRCFFAQRGVYRFGPIKVACQYPFGLVRAWFLQRDSGELHVAPRLGELKPTWNKRLGALAAGMASAERRRGWLPDEFFGLRQWQVGDSQRWIHWRSTAKRGQLMVRQFDQPTDRDFALLLDLWAPPTEDGQLFHEVELGASFVATVLAQLNYSIHGRVAIAVCGLRGALFTNQVSGEFVGSVMQELATALPASDVDVRPFVGQLAVNVSPGTPLIVATTRTPSQIAAMRERWAGLGSDEGWESSVLWIPIGSPEFVELFTAPAELNFEGMPVGNTQVVAATSEE